MRRLQFLAYSLALGLTAGLAACGGGGDSDPGTDGPTNNFPPQVPLAYSGATAAATVSATTAGTIASNVLGASGASVGGGAVAGVTAEADATSPQPTGAAGLARRLSSAMRPGELTPAGGSAMAGAAIDQTTPCDSGTVRTTGTVADNGTGTVSVAYNMCRTGGDTLNGPASLKIDAYDQTNKVVTDGTLTITRINFTGPGVNSDFTGTLRTVLDTGSQTQTLTANIITQDNNTKRMTRSDNLVIANHYDSVLKPTFFTESITGRVYDSVAGYVDVSTQTAPFTAPWGPLYFATSTQAFPDWGILFLSGATSAIRVTSLGVDLAKVEVDANGDGTFESSARVRWVDFNTAAGADLADTDGDGMHNSWETNYGLNAASAADATVDSDGDGFSNFAEYLAGSSPATNGSIPAPARHIWVTGNRDLAVDANGQIQIFVGDTGSGVLLDPATAELGATFTGATEPNGSANTSVTDAQGRTFTLSPTATPTIWTLSSSTGASITVTIAGTDPGSLIRYGTRGLAFRTMGASGAGYVYLVESTTLIP